jgi:hypothetical protein
MASDPVTWTALKTSLANWLNRTDLSTTEIPEAIALFERRAQRTIFSPERQIETTLATVAGTETVSLPSDLWGIKAAYISSDPKVTLEPMTLAELRNNFTSGSGKPCNYAIRGETMVLGPTPDGAYDIEMTYIQTIPVLGASVADNWLLLDHPDAYLYGSLHELHLLLHDVEKATIFEGKLQQAISEINQSTNRRMQGNAPIRIRPPSFV